MSYCWTLHAIVHVRMSEGARASCSRVRNPGFDLALEQATVRKARKGLLLAGSRPLLEARAMPATYLRRGTQRDSVFLLRRLLLDPCLLLNRVDALYDALGLVLYGLAQRLDLVEAILLGRLSIFIRVVGHALLRGVRGHLSGPYARPRLHSAMLDAVLEDLGRQGLPH